MFRKILVLLMVMVISGFCLNGCKKSESGSEPNETKTMAEYETEAEEEINEENMEQELQELEKAIDADVEANSTG